MNFVNSFFRFDNFSYFVGIFIIFFSILTIIYSLGFFKPLSSVSGCIHINKRKFQYYLYILFTSLASLGAVFANNLLLFMVFWGFLGLLLYLLIGFGQKDTTPATAKKAFIIIGGTDALMLLGLAFIWRLAGTFEMDKLSLALNSKMAVVAYICLALGAFAKAGAMPFHTWVPDTAEDAPASVTAFLPASLDKLLGIYFLARISLDIFEMNAGMNTFLMVIGSFTIVAAVMMALVQHDFKRLLGYHAVSQVGYMVLGIGTANPVGIAGGLFHMLNHAIYKSCLFFCSGAVERKSQTTDLNKLGGFAKIMPVTFLAFLIASFAISGVPPFNGFFSKWMVYQGIIETAKSGGYLWVIWLVAAMFGSVLTLASFMKLIHAVFLGQPSKQEITDRQVKEENAAINLPLVILAFFCVLFGVFAYQIPLKMFIFPSLGIESKFMGTWDSSLAAILIVVGIIIGIAIYFLGQLNKVRKVNIFIGGEEPTAYPEMRISGTEFYNTIKDIGILRFTYKLSDKKLFDLYEVGSKITFGINKFLRYLHNGILPTYLAWCLLGMGILFYILLIR